MATSSTKTGSGSTTGGRGTGTPASSAEVEAAKAEYAALTKDLAGPDFGPDSKGKGWKLPTTEFEPTPPRT